MSTKLIEAGIPAIKRIINKHRTIYPPQQRYDSDDSLDSISDLDTPQPYTDEQPPSYQSSLAIKGALEMKTEMQSPLKKARIRKWCNVDLEVNNTQVKITKYYDRVGLIKRTHTYSLQFAEVGLALDCPQRPYSFRLRVESKQFIFDCPKRAVMSRWLTAIEIGIGLSLPLELRQLPEETHRRRVRRVRTNQSDVTNNVSANRDSDRIEVVRRTRTTDEAMSDDIDYLHQAIQLSRYVQSRFNSTGELRKWHPIRQQSRFSFRDFPQLLLNSSWEGMNTLYKGRWAQVTNNRINLVSV